jgi:hypothetical protein
MDKSKGKYLGVVHRPGCTKPDVHTYCDCGENRSCRTCGWGSGAWPCTCKRAKLKESSLR